MTNPNGILYEVDELLKFIEIFNGTFCNLKKMKAKKIRDNLTLLLNTSNSLLHESCQQQKSGSSMVCSRPRNHLPPHRQSAAEWD